MSRKKPWHDPTTTLVYVISFLIVLTAGIYTVGTTGDVFVAALQTVGQLSWADWLKATAFPTALLVASLGLIWTHTRRRIAAAAEDPGQTLRRRIAEVNRAFAETASLMDDLGRDLEAQQVARDALVLQADEQQRLLEINQEQAEKIRHILVGETKSTIRAERRQQWMFFALGILVSIPIGVAINLLVP
ncbi:hypothetical protein [Nonomuraea jabiensis]|uniref:hypothetical protein n=1 Tax=Nonomuraea jabiensis TaxID=882448 RepID=UPI003D734279